MDSQDGKIEYLTQETIDRFDPAERFMVATMIEFYGTGEHPALAPHNLTYFAKSYARECMEAARREGVIEAGFADGILAKLA